MIRVKDLTSTQRRLWNEIRKHERMAVEHSWRGVNDGDPEGVPAIEKRYELSKRRLLKVLSETLIVNPEE